jgi:formate hydrogenlyase subunit 3/multisubunit Na+/H+ antiporter MnhD subunit
MAIIGLPIAGALLSLAAPGRTARACLLLVAAAMPMLAAGLARDVLHGGPLRYAVGGWPAPLGIQLHADGLSALLLLAVSAIGTAISVYTLAYFHPRGHTDAPPRSTMFESVWLLGWGGLNGLLLSGDLFNLYVCLEILTLTSICLIAVAGTHAAINAALRYLQVALAGSLFYLLGVAILYGMAGTLDLALLATQVSAEPAFLAAFALMGLGLLMKAAVFPAHFWLPPAHANAPAPASALLSGLVVTASFYMLLRIWSGLYVSLVSLPWALLLGILGATSIVWGGLQALRQDRLKMVVAYSTVSQVGYGFLLFPLAFGGAEAAELAWMGAVYFVLSHALAKAAAFLAAGALMAQFGRDGLDALRGAAWHSPLVVMAFGLAAVSLMGLPPSAGFLAKWMLLKSALGSGQWWWAVVIAGGSLLAAAYLFRVLEITLEAPGEAPPPARPSRGLSLPALALALAPLILGILADWPLRLLAVGPVIPGMEGTLP